MPAIPGLLGAAIASPQTPPPGDALPKPKDASEAARQFEALLIGQLLRSAHSSEESEDPTMDTSWDIAAQQFAQVMSDNGGLGLAKLITSGLEKKPDVHPMRR